MQGTLEALGWGPFFEAQLTPGERAGLRAGRAVADRGRRLLVRFEEGEALVTIPGSFRARGEAPPVVGPGDAVVGRPMMYGALSYDHRIVDGREAVSFLVRVKEAIEDPERLLLEV